MAFLLRSGTQRGVLMLMDSTSANLAVGTAVTLSGGTAGYIKEVDASGEKVEGFTMQAVDSPSADGEAAVLVDVSNETIYEAPPDTGTATQAQVHTNVDCGADGVSVNVDASAGEADLKIVDLDTTANTVYVRRTGA